MEDLVSVIVPVYNSEKYLQACLDSLKKQKYSNIEVLLINDGSFDHSREICEKICKFDKRFKLYNNKNHGVSYSRNYGIERASGKYLCFIDSDDVITEDFVEVLVKNIVECDCDLSICSIQGFKNRIPEFENSDGKKNDFAVFFTNLTSILFSEFGGYLANKLYRKSIIDDHSIRLNKEIFICEDLLFNLEYLKHCLKIAALDETMYYYRVHSSSSYYNLANKNWFSILDAYGELLKYSFDCRTEKKVYYNLYMTMLEAKYRYLKHFKNDDVINTKIKSIEKKLKGKFRKLEMKQKAKIMIFRVFPKITMCYKMKKVGE